MSHFSVTLTRPPVWGLHPRGVYDFLDALVDK